MSDDTKVIQDAGLYERMNVPYPTQEEAKAALNAFLDDVLELREKHRISNFVISASARGPEGPTGTSVARGDNSMAAILSTQLYRRFAVPLLQRLMPNVDEE